MKTEMVLENTYGLLVLRRVMSMMVAGKMIKEMAIVNNIMRMGTNIMEIGRIIKGTV
jgi:hypothetical protein